MVEELQVYKEPVDGVFEDATAAILQEVDASSSEEEDLEEDRMIMENETVLEVDSD